ncbi:MAG: sulfatase-like hydrolase/transferase [Anaerolineales bacterium]|nr:sulfatase-like hydrolase/transferase [Anaerolineales bacterium]
MPASLNRRDFLKLSASVALAGALGRLPAGSSSLRAAADPKPNIIVVLFDALSAFNLSLYGYRRKTSPNLERFAERAVVYHNHHSAGNFTTPSTASLFTSAYPWTHRAYNLSSLISPQVEPHNLFFNAGRCLLPVCFCPEHVCRYAALSVPQIFEPA